MKILYFILLAHFSLIALLPMGDLGQLTKIAYLVEHYEVHQLEAALLNEEVSFMDFLHEHLIELDEHQHEDGNQHEDLPLKNITTSHLLFFESFVVQEKIKPTLIAKEQVIYSKLFFQIGHLNPVFRPPSRLIA